MQGVFYLVHYTFLCGNVQSMVVRGIIDYILKDFFFKKVFIMYVYVCDNEHGWVPLPTSLEETIKSTGARIIGNHE